MLVQPICVSVLKRPEGETLYAKKFFLNTNFKCYFCLWRLWLFLCSQIFQVLLRGQPHQTKSYCREMLSNLRDLEKHKCLCQGPKNSCDKIKPFCNEPCEPGRFELSSVELLSFKNMLIGAYTSERIPCSICSQDFESESFLQLHILQAHIEPMKT